MDTNGTKHSRLTYLQPNNIIKKFKENRKMELPGNGSAGGATGELEITSKKVGNSTNSTAKEAPHRARPLFGFESLKQILPRLGRRSTLNNETIVENKSDEDDEETEDSNSETVSLRSPSESRQKPPTVPPRRKVGWGEELRSASRQRTSSAANANNRRDSFGRNRLNSVDEDIPSIPDIDEIIDDTNLMELSNVTTKKNRLGSFKDLNSDLSKTAAFSTLDGVNLGLLVERLYPESSVQEPDELWAWETLFTQVASEINSETEGKVN